MVKIKWSGHPPILACQGRLPHMVEAKSKPNIETLWNKFGMLRNSEGSASGLESFCRRPCSPEVMEERVLYPRATGVPDGMVGVEAPQPKPKPCETPKKVKKKGRNRGSVRRKHWSYGEQAPSTRCFCHPSHLASLFIVLAF